MKHASFIVDLPSERLITFLKNKLKGQLTTTEVKWLIEHQHCKVNGLIERFSSRQVHKGDKIILKIEQMTKGQFDPTRILLEDDNFAFYNKPAYVCCETLAKQTPWKLAHRIDRDTTGVLALAKTDEALAGLEALFKDRLVDKTYLAWVYPIPKGSSGVIEARLDKKFLRPGLSLAVVSKKGKTAITEWKIKRVHLQRALLQLHPKTGRMHQIRAHLQELGSPIVGDPIYGGKAQSSCRPLLHAYNIHFVYKDKTYSVTAPPPEDFS